MAARLYTGQPGTSSAAAYTSSNAVTTVTGFVVCNPTGTAETFDAWLVPSGGSATDANKIVDSESIAANDQSGIQVMVGVVLNNDEAIHLSAGTAATLTVHIFGAS